MAALVFFTFNFAQARKCHLYFNEFGVCAEILWPDPPLTFIANDFEVHFFHTESGQPVQILPKFFITIYNYYESRWGVPPDISQPKEFENIRYVTNLFFDKPGYWLVYLHLSQEKVTSSTEIKVHLEDME